MGERLGEFAESDDVARFRGPAFEEEPKPVTLEQLPTDDEFVIIVKVVFAEAAVRAKLGRYLTAAEIENKTFTVGKAKEGETALVISRQWLNGGYNSWFAFHQLVYQAMAEG